MSCSTWFFNRNIQLNASPSRKTLKPAPHDCPSNQTLMNAPQESCPSTSLITPNLICQSVAFVYDNGRFAKCAFCCLLCAVISYLLAQRRKILIQINLVSYSNNRCPKHDLGLIGIISDFVQGIFQSKNII